MDLLFLTKTELFRGTTTVEVEELLRCLNASVREYEKGEVIYRAGQTIERLGMVIQGGVTIESDDIWGNKSILSHVEPGAIFGETYACIAGEPLLINVVAAEKSQILFLEIARALDGRADACPFHGRLAQNLLQICARKNLLLSRRILHTSKTIRGRLLSYFSEQAQKSGSHQFTIPFNRQQLADYLNVDRSALSGELSKMKAEGILNYEKNAFVLSPGAKD